MTDQKTDYRLLLTAAMGVFVIAVMCWGVYGMIRDMNQTETVQTEQTKVKKQKKTDKKLDENALITNLLKTVAFETELKKLDDSVAGGMIATEEGTKLQVYMGNGSYADEIIVMTAENEKAAQTNQENAKTHLDEMETMFRDYIPKEAKKIENAVRVRCGCYVIVCVTSDTDTAKKVIDAAIDQ